MLGQVMFLGLSKLNNDSSELRPCLGGNLSGDG